MVLSEGVLRRPVGGHEVMREQLEYLMRPRDRANVTIQVLPFDAGVHPSMVGTVHRDDLPRPRRPRRGEHRERDRRAVPGGAGELRVYDEMWSTLQASALSADDSQAFLKSTSFGYRMKEGMK